jgi:hypothetical protein
MFLPFLQIEVEDEALGSLTLALMVLASLIVPFNIFLAVMRKWGVEYLGMDKQKFNDWMKTPKKLSSALHVISSILLVVVVTYHTYAAWGAAREVLLHYAAIIGIYILFITGILALYVPLPSWAKKAMWGAHAKYYLLFAIVVAIIAIAHLFIGD